MSTLTIATVQFDIKWLDKAFNLSRLDRLLASIDDVDLVLLPETFATGFSIDVPECEELAAGETVLPWLKRKAESLNAVIAGSVLVKKGEKKVNRFYWVYPSGEVEFYDKRHLFRLGNEQDFVEQGNERKIMQINGIKILPLVCYDLRFPVWSRNRQDYDLMINVANWPAIRRHVWDTLLKARAMENQSYVVGVNRIGSDAKGVAHNGGTAIYDFKGEVIVSSPDNQQSVLIETLNFSLLNQFKAKFPAYLDADNFDII